MPPKLFPLLLLSLLLLPAAADPLPDPEAYSVIASTCVPDPRFAYLLAYRASNIRFATGRFDPDTPAAARCAIPLRGTAFWSTMQVVFVDPDSRSHGATVAVLLYRLQAGGSTQLLAKIDSNLTACAGLECTSLRHAEVRLAYPDFDFSRYTYWLEILLVRKTPHLVSPRIHTIWLFDHGGWW